MGDTIELRVAAPEDYDFLYALHCTTMRDYIEETWGWDEVWQQNHFKQHFQPGDNHIILLNGCEVGRIEMGCNENGVRIGNIQILPASQSKGVGRLFIT